MNQALNISLLVFTLAAPIIGCSRKPITNHQKGAPMGSDQPQDASTTVDGPQNIAFEGAPAPGYLCRYGSSLGSSRVGGKPREYQHLRRLEIGAYPNYPDLIPLMDQRMPLYVLIAPAMKHIVIEWHGHYDVRDEHGEAKFAESKARGIFMFVEDEDYYYAGSQRLWDGKPGPLKREGLGVHPRQGWHTAWRFGPDRIIGAGQNNQMIGAENVTSTGVRSERRGPGPRARVPLYHWGHESYLGHFANLTFPRSSAAISANWWTVVGLQEGKVFVLGPDGDSEGSYPVPRWSVDLPYYVDQVSIVPPGIALFEGWTGGGDTMTSEDGSLPTTVHYLTSRGDERWRATVPFRAGQPPIDCGDGRICVAGEGLASVKDGRVEWSVRSPPLEQQPSWPKVGAFYWEPPAPVRATAFEEGTLAVAERRNLRIVGRDGSIKQQFTVPDGEVIYTPPAIAPDGRVWVATQHALYTLE